MVSSGSVNNDLNSVKSVLSSYSSQISGFDGSWKGTSHDSIISKAEAFVSEYTSAIESGMTAFASACDKYKEYKSYKDALKAAQSNLSQANSLKDSAAQTTYSNQVSEYTEKMNSIKSEIESLLSTASSNKLTATSAAGSVSSNSLFSGSKGRATASPYVNCGTRELTGANLDFVNSIKDKAVEAYNEYGVLPSLTIAQAIQETGWGKSMIGNNIFGIKAGSNWKGKTINCSTGEQNPDGSRYTVDADFRDYDSIDDSIIDHAKLLNTDTYKKVIESKNYKDACIAVRECGYATSLDYSKNLISLVEMYGLDQWDPKDV